MRKLVLKLIKFIWKLVKLAIFLVILSWIFHGCFSQETWNKIQHKNAAAVYTVAAPFLNKIFSI